MKKRLDLTEQEAQELIMIIDIAVKAAGLNIASSALYFAERIKNAPIAEENPLNNVPPQLEIDENGNNNS